VLNLSFLKLAAWLSLVAAAPAVLVWLLAAGRLAPGAGEWFRLGAGLATAAALAGAWALAYHWHRRQARQVDSLVEYCHRLALGEPDLVDQWPPRPAELGRLGMAIQVLREALVDYLSLYRRFYEAAPDMFLSLSPAGGRILDANQAFCQAVGRLRAEVLGRPVDEFVELEMGWEQALKGRPGLCEGRVPGDRGPIQVEASISLEPGPENQPWVIGAILRDVTQREAMHRELIAKSAALEQALKEIRSVEELKDQFLTTLSHELKTPLVAIKGFLQMVRSGRAQGEQQQEYLDVCWRNLAKLEGQINNLLDLARLAHAKDQYEMVPVDLASVVRTAAENLRPVAEERGVTLDLTGMPPEPVMVRGNMEKLVQLVDNLLVNAVKYNRDGGEVRLFLAREADQAALEVADSGIGMEREQMAKIFNRFYRAEVSGTGRLEGLGIGLSLVQEIVRLHGGDIRVQSRPGQGTVFSVRLEAAA
jgi:PAS domain S-box-containing protein